MKMNLFNRIVEEMGRYLFFVQLFNWGEPFMNSHLADMVGLLKGYGVQKVEVSSNLCIEISDSTIHALINEGLDILTVSIDGFTQQSYSKYRVRGELALALSNMERFANAKRELGMTKPLIQWKYLVFSHNEQELKDARKHARRLGVDFRAVAPYVDVVHHPDWLSSIDKYVMDIYKKKADAPEVETVQAAEGIPIPSEKRSTRCDWHYLFTAINSNGSVTPCCGIWQEKDDFGFLDDKAFSEVWNNDMFKTARRYLKNGRHSGENGNVCLKCPAPEIMGYAHSELCSILLNAPRNVLKKARQLLPDHPVVRELGRLNVVINGILKGLRMRR